MSLNSPCIVCSCHRPVVGGNWLHYAVQIVHFATKGPPINHVFLSCLTDVTKFSKLFLGLYLSSSVLIFSFYGLVKTHCCVFSILEWSSNC